MTTKIKITLLLVISTLGFHAQNTVIKAGHFFDSRNGKMLDNQMIIVQKGKIKEVGTNLKINEKDTIIDLSNSWVLPGLMDCHVHITANLPYRNVETKLMYVEESTSLRAIRGVVVAKQFLDNGFTTIKEIGNDANYATADIIKSIKKGWIQGPTIIYAGKIIAPYGGQTRGINTEHEHFWDFEYLDADTPDEIKKAVRKNIYNGATVIKMVTGDNGIYNTEDIKAAVDEAKKYGLKVTVHTNNDTKSATNVILGGAAAIEHGFELDDTQLKLMKDKGTFLVGTDFSYDNWYAYGMDSEMATTYSGMVTDRLKRAYKIGTKMAFGTDIIVDIQGLNRVQSNLKVLNTWKAAAIPSSYILQTMTINAAELLGIEKERGVLEQSYYADIIALKNNPIDDIEAIKTVQFVMKEGKVIRRD
ncbi:amidohydrolase family protein [Flavobacterium granuli]|uniref:Imidazolonepropionase-like amidohydrolase n=1 Tax=Flavobacterium granuli TaxID=280093 RepID=A0ABU1RYB2_9FLAO|nr:amidohydrolase family protein [Flavobacterium granuli]MDR6843734.1 imidazolonepropionase-like amidohydrolase [Flavobacterium granuli]